MVDILIDYSATRGFISGITYSFMFFGICLFACAVFQVTNFKFVRPQVMLVIIGTTLFFGLLLLSLSILELPDDFRDSVVARVVSGIALIVGIVLCTSVASVAIMQQEREDIVKRNIILMAILATISAVVVIIYAYH